MTKRLALSMVAIACVGLLGCGAGRHHRRSSGYDPYYAAPDAYETYGYAPYGYERYPYRRYPYVYREHERDHRRHDGQRRREHRQVHRTLGGEHREAHERPLTRAEHRRVHRRLEREHRDAHRHPHAD